jgi:hypothetical protein
MSWLLLLPLIWLGIALVLGIFVGTCIRIEAGDGKRQRQCEARSASVNATAPRVGVADPRVGMASAAAGASASVAR